MLLLLDVFRIDVALRWFLVLLADLQDVVFGKPKGAMMYSARLARLLAVAQLGL